MEPESKVKVLRIGAVADMLSLSKPVIYAWAAKGLFPKPIKLGPQASGWLVSDIEAWLASRSAANDDGNAK